MIIKNIGSINLISALENNIRNRFIYFQKQSVGMEVIDWDSKIMLINSYEMTDMFNIIYCHGPVNKSQVASAIDYFKKKSLPFAWWTGFEDEDPNLPSLLVQNGLRKTEDELAMAINLNSVEISEITSNLAIKQVNNHQTLMDFVQVVIDVIPCETKPIQTFYKNVESIIYRDNSSIEFYVAYIDSQPVGTCSVFFSENVAGIFDIISASHMRGKGIGSAMTLTAMKEAIKREYEFCVLTATNDAKFLYEKLGFKSLKAMYVYTLANK